jgi:hypothetical protein
VLATQVVLHRRQHRRRWRRSGQVGHRHRHRRVPLASTGRQIGPCGATCGPRTAVAAGAAGLIRESTVSRRAAASGRSPDPSWRDVERAGLGEVRRQVGG